MKKQSGQNQSHIRFTQEEYHQLLSDAKLHNESIPNLLKTVYFRKKRPQPSLPAEDARRIVTALNRIGNNINQIARHLNQGFREGFNPAVEELRDDIHAMKQFVMGHHGNRQN